MISSRKLDEMFLRLQKKTSRDAIAKKKKYYHVKQAKKKKNNEQNKLQ